VIGKIYKLILDFLRSRDALTQIIWKIKINKKLLPITYDLTTLVLKKSFDKYKKKGVHFDHYLDMGCGQVAILGQYQKKIDRNTHVTSADIYKDFLDNAKENVLANSLEINFVETDMFSNIKNKYDLITFNPPYVPLRFKKKDIKYDKISFGGDRGTNAIDHFLENASNHLTENGIIFLGVNLFYVPLEDLNKIVERYKYQKIEIIKKFLTNVLF